MGRIRSALIKSIPVFLITIVTLGMSFFGFNDMLSRERDTCWNYLSVATKTMSEKVQLRFDANLTLLQHIADAIVLHVDMEQQGEVLSYLTEIQQNDDNIFERLDILLPDNTLILQNGEIIEYGGDTVYRDLEAEGLHVSLRYTDRLTNQPVVYCLAPICDDGETVALLIGMVPCDQLPKYFPSYSYGGQAKLFLVDRRDGSILIDRVHENLGNLYAAGSLNLSADHVPVDFADDIAAGETGSVALAGGDGGASYMYYMPVTGYDWTAAVMISESVAFAGVIQLRATLQVMAVVEIVLLAIYLIWNVAVNLRLTAHEERARRMEVERISNEAKSSFLSTMSHDIRTPLNGIVGMLEVIERHGDEPTRVKECLHKIGVSAQYLMALTNDVLDINEIDSGKFHLSNEPVNLTGLVEDLDVLVRAKAENSGVTCHFDCSRVQHSHVLGSEVHLRRILVNLVTNAIKYNRPGGEVWVELTENTCRSDEGEYTLTVRDTGIGMTKEFQRTMFNSFAQESSDARTRYMGHGLGLTIVHKLVEKMGGTIRVESEKDRGSTFMVTVLLTIDHESCAGGTEAVEPPDDLTGVRILLAEDNELNMEIASILLTDAGAEVTKASNGREAVEKFASHGEFSFDVILMDVRMPEMDGLEATRTIRRMQRKDAARIPIIAMTASTFAEDVRRCREAGMNEHVGKPLNMAEMIAKIAKQRSAARDA